MAELEDWLNARLTQQSYDEIGLPSPVRVTIRLDAEVHYKLTRLANALGMSKTGCAEEVATRAIQDAYNHYAATLDENDSAVEQHELREFMEGRG